MPNKISKSKFQIIKKIFLPTIGILLIALAYFGVNGVKAELPITKKDKVKKESLAERPLNIVAVDDTEAQDVVSPSPSSILAVIESTPEVKNIPAQTSGPVKQKVTLRISAGSAAGNYPFDYVAGETVYQLLTRIAAKNEFTIGAQDYGAMGMLVVRIGNLTNTNDICWFFYINGKISEIGSSSYQVLPNDLIEWRYHEYWIY